MHPNTDLNTPLCGADGGNRKFRKCPTVWFAGLLFIAATALFSFATHPVRSKGKAPGIQPTGTVHIIIDKSDYELQVYDEEGWFATYPVVFGSKSQEDKMMAGDRRTPEGTFTIISKKPHPKWHEMLMLDYPNDQSWAKFRQRKASGQIPRSAGIGGGIAIHGTWPHDEIAVDNYDNWTQGCVSMRNADLDEICEYVQPGVKVTIRK